MTPPDTIDGLTALESELTGRVVWPQDPDYDAIRAGFNAMIDKRPAAIARVRSEADVAACIRAARALALPLAIRAGGHSAPGFGACEAGLVIDVRELDEICNDADAMTIRCGSGLTWKQFDEGTSPHGLAVTGGRVSSTGVTGLTIGSGSGWLERAMGLTSDSLVGARLVTAEGETVRAEDDPDLLWALRGGGGNFGVITELTFAARPLGPEVLGGVRMFPYDDAAGLLKRYRDVIFRAPRELCGGVAIMEAPPAPFVPDALRGKPVVAMIVLWAGDPADAAEGIACLDAMGEPAVDLVGPMLYAALQQVMDAGAPAGHRDYFKGGFMTELTDAAIDSIVALGADLQAPLTQIICAPLGADSAYADVGEEHSAIGHRDENWSFQVLSLWQDPAEDEAQKDWTKAASDVMSSYSGMVSYPNFISADETEPSKVEEAYTPTALAKLRAVKDRYDPQNVFRINHNIRPTGAA